MHRSFSAKNKPAMDKNPANVPATDETATGSFQPEKKYVEVMGEARQFVFI
jgi:hypothetical protein